MNEREVFDFFGIGFINHPDMRRLYLRDDWVGYPLRKDYDQSGETNPLRMTNEVAHDSSPSYELQPDGSIIRRRNVLFEEDEYVINIGPQAKSSKSSTYTAATSTGASKNCAKA